MSSLMLRRSHIRPITAGVLAALTCAVLPACAGGGGNADVAGKSPEKYCETFYKRAVPFREKAARVESPTSQDQALASLLTVLSGPGDLAVIFDDMVTYAPDDIRPETVAARDAFQNMQNNLGANAENPLGAVARSLATGVSANAPLQAVGAYLQKHCPLDSTIARKYVGRPTAANAKPSTGEDRTRATPSDQAPSVGTVLATQEGGGGYSVATNGSGFTIVDSRWTDGEDDAESTATTYDAAGTELATIPGGSLTGTCGAQDIQIADGDRVVITQRLTSEPARGINPAQSALSMEAWNASTGDSIWTVPLLTGKPEEVDCQILQPTVDGRHALVAKSKYDERSTVIDLKTGELRHSRYKFTILGNYGVRLLGTGDPQHGGPIIDLRTDATLGRLDKTVEVWDDTSMASIGLYNTDSVGTSPPTGLSSDGERLFVRPNDPDEITAYSLPSGRVAWRREDDALAYIYGDQNGKLLVNGPVVEQSGSAETLLALDDRTGKTLWSVPSGDVCGLTASQMLLFINSQNAIIDMDTGEQISYSEATGDGCSSSVLPGGIETDTGSIDPTQSHSVTVTQVLEP